VAKVIFALRIALHVVPFEVDAATRAFLADRLKEIHGECELPLGATKMVEIVVRWLERCVAVVLCLDVRDMAGVSHVKAVFRAGFKVARQSSS
jgi:hypothetical protein